MKHKLVKKLKAEIKMLRAEIRTLKKSKPKPVNIMDTNIDVLKKHFNELNAIKNYSLRKTTIKN